MYLCYVDESGTPDIPGNTSHYVLVGLSIPIERWKECDDAISIVKNRYGLKEQEIHAGWLIRPYNEQKKVLDFEKLKWPDRRDQIETLRKEEILQLQKGKNSNRLKLRKKYFRSTEGYIHLTYEERKNFIKEIAVCISKWSYARLFAECVDKIYFNPRKAGQPIDEQSFEQIVSRFEQYLHLMKVGGRACCYGLIIHDNNETVAKRHTALMKKFLQNGTLWTKVKSIIETPLFVNSQLTSMVQIADICAYSLRRYFENNEEELFDLIFQRADRKDGVVVGVRHFTKPACPCKICSQHKKK